MAKYPSTLLPQDNTPQENQKAVLDLLDKTNKVHDDAMSGIKAAKAELQKEIAVVTTATPSFVSCIGNPATGANIAIPFTEVYDPLGLFSAGIFTFPKDGVSLVCMSAALPALGVLYIGKGATIQYIVLQSASTNWAGSGGALVPGVAGDTIYIVSDVGVRVNATASLSIIFYPV